MNVLSSIWNIETNFHNNMQCISNAYFCASLNKCNSQILIRYIKKIKKYNDCTLYHILLSVYT